MDNKCIQCGAPAFEGRLLCDCTPVPRKKSFAVAFLVGVLAAFASVIVALIALAPFTWIIAHNLDPAERMVVLGGLLLVLCVSVGLWAFKRARGTVR